jgi:hypothetical protein
VASASLGTSGSSLAEAEAEAEGAAYEDAEEEAEEEARELAEAARSRALRGRSENPSVLPMSITGTQMEEAGSMIVRARPACVSMRQHTSAYVSIRQQMKEAGSTMVRARPACVSIREHTSAYVRIR